MVYKLSDQPISRAVAMTGIDLDGYYLLPGYRSDQDSLTGLQLLVVFKYMENFVDQSMGLLPAANLLRNRFLKTGEHDWNMLPKIIIEQSPPVFTLEQEARILHLVREDLASSTKALRDRRPHSRACGIAAHVHGTACSPDCPTCGGRSNEESWLT